jgi:hypothetical protein
VEEKAMKTGKKVFSIVLFALLALTGSAPAQWTEPVIVAEVSTSYLERSCFISYDMHSLFITKKVSGREYIYEASREGTSGPFNPAVKVFGPSWDVQGAWVSADRLRMYYKHELPSRWYLKKSERSSVAQPWPDGASVTEINAYGDPSQPCLTLDELIIVFTCHNMSGGVGGYDLWMATRDSIDLPFEPPVNLTELNSAFGEGGPSISPDGLVIYFGSNREGPSYIYEATRQSSDEPFGTPVRLDEIGALCANPTVSIDNRVMYFSKDGDIYVTYLIVKEVAVDIKPRGCPNPINLASCGVLPATVLGSEDLDVNVIDIATIRLAGVAPIRSNYQDVATPVTDGNECECNTEDPDGHTDLTLKFETQAIVQQLMNIGDLVAGDELVLTLTGSLADGTPIEGTDCVVVVGKVPRPLAAKVADINQDGMVDLFDFSALANYWLEPSAAGY